MKTIALTLILAASPLAAQGPDPLMEARKLYESAEYAGALAALETIEPASVSAGQAHQRLVYQALCLLALERQPALDAKIQEIVWTDPFFQPGPDVPPRLRMLLDDARERMRPALVEAHYRSGKARFDAGDHAAAIREFTLAITLADGAGAAANGGGALDDITLLAEGFRDLSKRALEAPRPPDTVVPPVVVQQDMPPWPASLTSRLAQLRQEPLVGVLEVVVTKTGEVGAVTLIKPIHPLYDSLLVAAAREWKYQPATRNGQPVEFVKRLNVKVTAR